MIDNLYHSLDKRDPYAGEDDDIEISLLDAEPVIRVSNQEI
jgi:hypothetical protein